ncbi:hypothetical protein [Streptomyces lydicus]|uniref:hypothetical protein n=1 Tax=Streptomyces lydicus TaxID=47763 RepID=UPI0037A22DB9
MELAAALLEGEEIVDLHRVFVDEVRDAHEAFQRGLAGLGGEGLACRPLAERDYEQIILQLTAT